MKHPISSRYWKILAVAAIGVSATAAAWLIDNLMSAFISSRPASAASMPQAVAARDARPGQERMASALLDRPHAIPSTRFASGDGVTRSIAGSRGEAARLDIRATFGPLDLAAARGAIRHHTSMEIAS